MSSLGSCVLPGVGGGGAPLKPLYPSGGSSWGLQGKGRGWTIQGEEGRIPRAYPGMVLELVGGLGLRLGLGEAKEFSGREALMMNVYWEWLMRGGQRAGESLGGLFQ